MNELNLGFELKTVAHLMRPWGKRARNLEQLRNGLASAPAEVIFHHAVQYRLRHPSAGELAPDDLSGWVRAVVHESETAERISFAVQTPNASAEQVRAALLEVLDRMPSKRREERGAPEGSEFVFLSALSVVFPIGRTIRDAQDAIEALTSDDPGVWFYHLIEEPWSGGAATLPEWLISIGEPRLALWLREAASSGRPIGKSRSQFLRRWRQSQIARRVSEGAGASEQERREASRRAVARLVRRQPRTDEPA
jgi:hypothetical protein